MFIKSSSSDLSDVCFSDAGLLYKRQLFFGLFDMTIHTAQGKVDTGKVWHELRRSVAGIPGRSLCSCSILIFTAPEGTNGASSFGHLTGGYSAGYYGFTVILTN
jgi:Zn-dependent oligopeptidase